MRTILRSLLIVFCTGLFSPFPQRLEGQESGSVRFLANFIPPLGGGYTAGCWGWTDTTTGREYALLGNYSGTSIVEITNVGSIVERDFVPGVSSNWREIQVHDHYAYVVSEGGGGTQIIDLSYLPDSAHLVKGFIHSDGGKSNTRGHTLHIRDGYMYLNGCATWSPGGILIFDLADPENPAYLGEYAGNYTHDSFLRNDTIYAAAIYGVGLEIIDATDKSAPTLLHTISYPGAGTHNVAVTDDGTLALTTDEINPTPKTLKIWSLESPPNFPKIAEYAGSPSAIVHNVFLRGSLAIMSYYTAGIRIVDISDPLNLVEIGGYDTRPGSESASYTGAWSVYPFFPSGKIIIGDMGNGMFVVDMNTAAPRPPSGFSVSSDYTTPTSIVLEWTDPFLTVAGDTLPELEIRLYRDGNSLAVVDSGIGTYTDTGLVAHQEYSYLILAVSPTDSSAPVERTAFAGGAAQPAMPGGFKLSDLAAGILLEWTNPVSQIDGTPLNDLEAVEIHRDGAYFTEVGATSIDTGSAVSFMDTTIGYHHYRIRARDNSIPANYSEFTDSILGYGGLLTLYMEDFESAPATFVVSGPWDTTGVIASGGVRSFTDSPTGNYADDAEISFITPRIIVAPGMSLTFKHIAIILGGDFGYVEVSPDRGETYTILRAFNSFLHPGWQDGSADPEDWFTESFSLDAWEGDTVSFRFRLKTGPTGNADGWYIDDIATEITTGVDDDRGQVPGTFSLHQNHPNPFNPSTTISYEIPGGGFVTVAVYDMSGREVRTLVSKVLPPGNHSTVWDGRTAAGKTAGSGAYLYRMTFGGHDGSHRSTEKTMLIIR